MRGVTRQDLTQTGDEVFALRHVTRLDHDYQLVNPLELVGVFLIEPQILLVRRDQVVAAGHKFEMSDRIE